MSKHSRAGGKFTRTHNHCIPSAGLVADIANRCEHVVRIRLGFITAKCKSAGGFCRVKIFDDGKSLLLRIRDNAMIQELRIYVTDIKAAKAAIIEGIKGLKIAVEEGELPH